MPFQRRVSGVHCVSGTLCYSVCDLEFQIDHVACLESCGIEELKDTGISQVSQGIYGINPHFFHAVEHLLQERLRPALSLMDWINPASVYTVDVLRYRRVTELRH